MTTQFIFDKNQTFYTQNNFDRLVVAVIGEQSEKNYNMELEQEVSGDTIQWTTPHYTNARGTHIDGTKSAGLPKVGDIFGFWFPYRRVGGALPPREGHMIIHQITSVDKKNIRDWWEPSEFKGSVLELSQPITSYSRGQWLNFKGPTKRNAGVVYNLKGKWKELSRNLQNDFMNDSGVDLI